ncbi:MAG: hypothetical protein L6Q54_04900 [Leptospiraceae bacterium]|nr:hypothetical protein [Leptospiraceae bacterium]MCK6380575.1 hypothetical protein [Leptospiraceae bacterium]NUM40344.1 hypothetical protein [Leptospiraceae bacterium]
MRKFFALIAIFLLSDLSVFSSEQLIEIKSGGTKIDWSNMKIITRVEEPVLPVIFESTDPDLGKPDTALNITESIAKTRKKSKDRLISEISASIENLKFDTENSILDKIQNSEKFREKFNKLFQKELGDYKVIIRGNKVISEIAIPFTGKGGLMNFLDIGFQTEDFPEFPKIPNPTEYTGLIVDVRHLKSQTSLLPRITTDRGLEIYSPELVSKNYAIDRGYVLFQQDPIRAMKHKKVGENPYYVYALSATGEYKTNFSISTEDTLKLFGNPKTIENLKRCKVIIVKDFLEKKIPN